MGVDEVDSAGRSPSRPNVGGEEQREQQRLPGAAPEVSHDPAPVREAEVSKRGGRDDVDLDARLTEVLDRVADEDPGDVVRPPRVRRREDEDLHSRRASPKATGSAAARVAKT